jgi:hypothetical protein
MKKLYYLTGIIFLLLVVNVVALPTKDNLMLYFPLENCTAVTADSIGLFSMNMTNANTPDTTVGKLGNGCYYTTNERHYNTALQNSTQIRTIEFWSNVSTSAKSEFGILNTTWGKDGITFFHNVGTGTRYFYAFFNSVNTPLASVSFVSSGYTGSTWHHNVLVMNGVNWTYYVDGTVTLVHAQTNLPLNIEGIYIGGEAISNNYSTGIVDNIAIWNTVMSASDVTWAYNSGVPLNYTDEFAPCEENWTQNLTFQFNSSQINGTLTNYPVLIKFTNTTLSSAQSTGDDIRFFEGSTQLSHEIDIFNQTTGELVAWVKVPSFNASTELRMEWNNSCIGNQENVTDVWSDYAAVWHLSEPLNGMILDSTANNNDGVASANLISNGSIVSTNIGKGINFPDGGSSGESVTINDSVSLSPTGTNMTFSVYVKSPSALQSQYSVIATKTYNVGNTAPYSAYMIYQGDISTFNGDYLTGKSNAGSWNPNNVNYEPNTTVNTWYKIDYRKNTTYQSTYINGVWKGHDADTGAFQDTAYEFRIGGNPVDVENYKGIIDEVRITTIEHDSAWLMTDYYNFLSSGFISIKSDTTCTNEVNELYNNSVSIDLEFNLSSNLETNDLSIDLDFSELICTGGVVICDGTADCTWTCGTDLDGAKDMNFYQMTFIGTGTTNLMGNITDVKMHVGQCSIKLNGYNIN